MLQPSTELKELMLRWYASYASGDVGITAETLSQEPALLTIGTDPAEWVVGYETIFPIYQAQIGAMGGIQIQACDLVAYSEGNVGWVADRPLVTLPDGTTIQLRSTLVFHREDGAWKVVQHHNSVGVPNEEVVQWALPLPAR